MTIEIPLTRGKVAIIDEDDFEIVSQHKWHAGTDGWNWYAQTNIPREGGGQRTIKMHRLLLGLTDPKIQVDHRDGDGLNNRRENIRACTASENQWNTGAQINNSSGFKGVNWDKQCRKWKAAIWVNGKRKHLGLHDTPEAAYAAYCADALELHGEFHNLGAPPTKRWSKPEFEIIHTGAPR